MLDPNPAPGQPLLPGNYGLRIAKTVGFGPSKESTAARQPTGGGATLGIPGGGQLRNIIGAPSTSRRDNLIVSMSTGTFSTTTIQAPSRAISPRPFSGAPTASPDK